MISAYTQNSLTLSSPHQQAQYVLTRCAEQLTHAIEAHELSDYEIFSSLMGKAAYSIGVFFDWFITEAQTQLSSNQQIKNNHNTNSFVFQERLKPLYQINDTLNRQIRFLALNPSRSELAHTTRYLYLIREKLNQDAAVSFDKL